MLKIAGLGLRMRIDLITAVDFAQKWAAPNAKARMAINPAAGAVQSTKHRRYNSRSLP
jgi:hypothetical protein